MGKVPFLYFGLPIGGDIKRLLFWEPVLNSIKSRLSGWKSRFLSFGGGLILFKSVLREVAKTRDDVGVDGGGWVKECVSRKVGDGANTYFWHDRWLRCSFLCAV